MSKKQKTIEELLEEAFVPEEEQPYRVPKNWVWTYVDTIAQEIKNGTTVKQNKDGLGVKVTRIESVQNNEIDLNRIGYIEEVSSVKEKDYYQPNDIVLSHINSIEHVGKTALIKGSDLPLVHGMNLLKIGLFKEKVAPEYAQYYMRSYQFRKDVRERVNRAVNQVSLNQKNLKTVPIPVAPLNEQKRIAGKIERLLNKMEETKQLIEEAKETFELRRAAILDKAFRGELTNSWRLENQNIEENKSIQVSISNDSTMPYEIPDTWRWSTLKDIAEFKNGYAFKSKDFVDQGIQLIRMGNLYKNKLALERNPVYLPKEYDVKILEKYTIKNGDILLSLTGTKYKRDYGYAVKVDGTDKPLLLNQRILSLKPKRMDEYVFYYLQSSTFRNTFFGFETGGVNQGNVGSKAVESILIPVPPLDEAKEIEKKLVAIFKKETDSLKILHVEEQLETLKQTILSKAFRGELGTNDPSEESAIELLKEVLQDKVK
ncbi:restriction endonuclease subunit S [Domibacillus aminovorans]|uniref:Restriction endonuclease subunit S n=1 Tax=Domibacillus aminovorans TaxID=29332 RepID=A0A177L4S3_9BACI|nr:restriction endonuclease subunit S [Domibacillus aminovorans]OAH60680.1 restriction endonuclease subunit S [Domibacillus aminovorans]